MNIWHDIDEERIKKDDFLAVIEIPKGCKNKYELDKKTGALRLDRVLYSNSLSSQLWIYTKNICRGS